MVRFDKMSINRMKEDAFIFKCELDDDGKPVHIKAYAKYIALHPYKRNVIRSRYSTEELFTLYKSNPEEWINIALS
jgi:hypothetical protein